MSDAIPPQHRYHVTWVVEGVGEVMVVVMVEVCCWNRALLTLTTEWGMWRRREEECLVRNIARSVHVTRSKCDV